jgi:hypothetical protein
LFWFSLVVRFSRAAPAAYTVLGGNQAFTLVAAFSGVAGQLQWDQTGDTAFLVQADVDGDGVADFSLQIYGAPGYTEVQAGDFVL